MFDFNRPLRGCAWNFLLLGLSFSLLNAPFWWLQRSYFLDRPWLNIELLLPVLFFGRFRLTSILALCLCWMLDLAVSQSATFHFTSAFEFVRSAQFLLQTNVLGFVSFERVLLALPFVFASLLAALCIYSAKIKTLPWRTCLVFAVCIVIIDVGNGSSIVSKRSVHLIAGNPARSPTFTLVVRAIESQRQTSLARLPDGVSAVDRADIRGWVQQHPNGSVVLMIVESMGWHEEPAIRAWLRDQIVSPVVGQRFRVDEIPIKFTGATTSAELRELCGLSGSYRNMSIDAGQACLPARLTLKGWQTRGYHGFSGNMFDRAIWWSQAGIQTRLFAESLVKINANRCGGGFPGMCDANVVSVALAHATEPRTFTYILSLNSHLPLTLRPIPPQLQIACRQASVTDESCLLTATIGDALAALRPVLENPDLTSPMVVVVGDHAPPFSDLASRREYAAHEVPALVLRPLDSGQ